MEKTVINRSVSDRAILNKIRNNDVGCCTEINMINSDYLGSIVGNNTKIMTEDEWDIITKWIFVERAQMPNQQCEFCKCMYSKWLYFPNFSDDWSQLQTNQTYPQLERFHNKYRKTLCKLANMQFELIYTKHKMLEISKTYLTTGL